MALVACATLTNVELTLAQELQFVVGYFSLQAGLFMVPLAIGSALWVGLWLVMLRFMRTPQCCRRLTAGSGYVSRRTKRKRLLSPQYYGYHFAAGILSIALSIGLTASSIAIINSAPSDKAGAAVSLEVTVYELSDGLGIIFFGILLSTTYSKTINLPVDLLASLHSRAVGFIRYTMIVAEHLGVTGIALIIALIRGWMCRIFQFACYRACWTATVIITLLAVFVLL